MTPDATASTETKEPTRLEQLQRQLALLEGRTVRLLDLTEGYDATLFESAADQVADLARRAEDAKRLIAREERLERERQALAAAEAARRERGRQVLEEVAGALQDSCRVDAAGKPVSISVEVGRESLRAERVGSPVPQHLRTVEVHLDWTRREAGSWRTTELAHPVVVVSAGYGGQSKRFPRRKDGSYNLAGARAAVLEVIAQREADARREREKADSRVALLRAVQESVGSDYSCEVEEEGYRDGTRWVRTGCYVRVSEAPVEGSLRGRELLRVSGTPEEMTARLSTATRPSHLPALLALAKDGLQ